MVTTTKTFYNPTQLHNRWSFHPESIRRMIRQGRLPAVRIGKRLLVSQADVEAFEQENPVVKNKGAATHV